MWRSTDSLGRLEKALEYRNINHEKINLYYDLHRTLIRRGITDAKLCDVYGGLIRYLEPKSCQMYHCEDHGAAGFCSCCKNLVPFKCQKHKDFLKRCKGRVIKGLDLLLKTLGDRVSLVNFDMEAYSFFDGLRKLDGFDFINKWSYRLKEDVWKELLKRKKVNEETP